MSLNEIAVDLTCDPEEFEPVTTVVTEEQESSIPGQFHFPRQASGTPISTSSPLKRYVVHGGMLRMARAMGDIGKPVQLAVHEALYRNPDYCEHHISLQSCVRLTECWI